jgi:hypothetical protein
LRAIRTDELHESQIIYILKKRQMKLPELKFIEADIQPGRRVLVTSDIHGNLDHLKAVLHLASFSADDILVVVARLEGHQLF